MHRQLQLLLPARAKVKNAHQEDNHHELATMSKDASLQPKGSPHESRETTGHVSFIGRWWGLHIAPDVPEAQCREHFALERTLLAYVRTASAFAQIGVTIAQLFKLPRESLHLSPAVQRLGHALGPTAQCFAIVTMLVGAFRCARQQGRIAHHGRSKPPGNMAWLLTGLLLVFVVLSLVAVRSH
ncbi:uncharacterized protein MYCFIDRAFT_210617 [Pseudocercospora fijiensis CIRAD86]|uniref:DUF202 domain-containing protein n=1 Tax=Pseudocercospora fijiensis (strain CIRAD86) TaxID=383855 RepID=M3A6T9_PSEFD|nr:uncharacterized protein MYCFIDRAFT_210617 [Pseudocercospora fijiensis CIRAD86]EME86804.1 hypothetical protein MYCFIDRAFT_210617 [Pseudocercospora fijiensis CIRAD86]